MQERIKFFGVPEGMCWRAEGGSRCEAKRRDDWRQARHVVRWAVEQVEVAYRELGVDAEAVSGLGGWKTSDDVAVAFAAAPSGK